MKTAQVWLLVVLCLLLPARGAVGAAMLCPMPSGTSAASGAEPTALRLMVSAESTGHAMHHASAVHEAGQQHDAGAHDQCNLCCDRCSATAMPSALPSLASPQPLATVVFDGLSASAPSFLSDGQERPPRIS